MTKTLVRKLILERKLSRDGKRGTEGYRHAWEKFKRRTNKMWE